jgi:hypothetical protein
MLWFKIVVWLKLDTLVVPITYRYLFLKALQISMNGILS